MSEDKILNSRELLIDKIKHDFIHEHQPDFPIRKHNFKNEVTNFVKKICDRKMITKDDTFDKNDFYHVIRKDFNLDIYIPSHNKGIIITTLWEASEVIRKEQDLIKSIFKAKKEASVDVIIIYEDDWVNKNNTVKNRIRILLNAHPVTTNGEPSEELKLRQVGDVVAKNFFDECSLEGYNPKANRIIGLYAGEVPVCMMAFEFIRDDVYKLLDHTCMKILNIKGSFGKLFKSFVAMYDPKEIFYDIKYGWESSFLLGLLKFEEGNYQDPEIKYLLPEYQYLRRDPKIWIKPEITQDEYLSRGILKIPDCGRLRYTWNKEKANAFTWEDHVDYADVMTLEDFIDCCKSGGFIDYDGHGYLATETKTSSYRIYPSHVIHNCLPDNPEFTHVAWFNR